MLDTNGNRPFAVSNFLWREPPLGLSAKSSSPKLSVKNSSPRAKKLTLGEEFFAESQKITLGEEFFAESIFSTLGEEIFFKKITFSLPKFFYPQHALIQRICSNLT
jgi:hypothetical protein